MRPILQPEKSLMPYQLKWSNDDSRWKFGLMARQVGKDYGAGYEGIRDIIRQERRGGKVDWLIAAPSERQSLESLQKWRDWAGVFKYAIRDITQERVAGSESLVKSTTILFPNGSRAIAVPGQPDTVRGFSANVLLTEFAFFENPDATWRAILPSVTNPMRGGVKKVRLITTPNGIGNKAHEIWAKNYWEAAPLSASRGDGERAPGSGASLPIVRTADAADAAPGEVRPRWSCHLVDIHFAAAQGLNVNVEELRSLIDDPDGWAQEYECQFMDIQSVLLPYELLATCESHDATTAVPGEFWQSTSPYPIDMGIDFGRKHDLTVCWSNALIGDVAQTVEVLELSNLSTPEQVELLRPRLKRARRVCLDYTGAGIGMGDYLVREFQEWKPSEHKYGKIELCVFSQGLKVELFSKLRMAFEKRGLRVPVNRTIREDLHSISRVASETGGITYRAPRGVGGHADRCTALALALRAGQGEAYSGGFHIFEDKHTERTLVSYQYRSTFP